MGTPHRIEETPVYHFEQLSDEAKEKARGWYRELGNSDDWWDSVYEAADTAAEILGIQIDRKGKHSPEIYFSGFCSQGDGAKFVGRYRYARGATAKIKAEFPKDEELHRIAKALQEVQRRWFYKLVADCTDSGRYQHSGCMGVEAYLDQDRYRDLGDTEEDVRQLMRDFADWIYNRLEAEDEWLNGDEQVDESIIANDYEFDATGARI